MRPENSTYGYMIDETWGLDSWILANIFFRILMFQKAFEVHKHARPVSNDLDRTDVVQKIYSKAYGKSSGSLSKSRRRRLRERQQTKGLMSKTIAVHVRYKNIFWFFCRPLLNNNVKWPRSASWTTRANFSYSHLKLSDFLADLAWTRFYSHWRTEQI